MEIKAISKSNIVLPALALRGLVMFPSVTIHLDVERPRSIAALKRAMNSDDKRLFLVTQRQIETEEPERADLYDIGVVAEIKQFLRLSDKTVRVLVEGLYKAKLTELYSSRDYFEAQITRIPVQKFDMELKEELSLIRALKQAFEGYAMLAPQMSKETKRIVMGSLSINQLFEAVIQSVMLPFEDKQEILELNNIYDQSTALIKSVYNETELLKLEHGIYEQVKENMDRNQQEYFLREQMKVISEQLGEDDSGEEIAEFEERIKAIQNISDESRAKLLKECDRLYKMPSSSQEANVIRTYVETCLEIPWDNYTVDDTDIKKAAKILDRDHYGMEKVKERILESLSVRKLNPELKGQIICLAGPPGVGKTSIAKAVAEALGRRYVRLSLGGVKDESDIRGHRKTYVGSMPGRIINALISSKSRNPLMLLDEIDKMGSDFRGDPSAAMLEVLDSEQNFSFRDHYIELPVDLSDVLFITTANSLDTIPGPLLDRMEIIELSSYTREEKFNIAKKHLVKKQRAKHGISASQLKISDSALYRLIDSYTRESGVRGLERAIAALCRKTARKIAEDENAKVSVAASNISKFMGPEKYTPEHISAEDEVGLVNGLAWTSVGGEMLQIEVSVVEGSGKLELTGNLGDVMKESAKTAVTYVRSVAKEYGIKEDFYKNCDIHIHAPEGAVPKDGPSAGVTITTALVSALSGIPVRRDVAMTGEVSLRGRVLKIGGLREKTMAAYRAGIKTVLIPEENLPDIAEMDKKITDNINFISSRNVSNVLKHALICDKHKTKKAVVSKKTSKAEEVRC